MRLLLLNKPFRVLTRFARSDERATLADHVAVPGVYPAGRLDYDSEGLLLLTDDGRLQSLIADPRHRLEKVYWAQVEGVPDEGALRRLSEGVLLNDGPTRPARAQALPPPAALWPRDPPIRYRAAIPTAWIELGLREGRNRQVRRMTAAVGHPTLRLVRWAIGPWTLEGLAPGEWREVPTADVRAWRSTLAVDDDPPRRVGGPGGATSASARPGVARYASTPRGPARSSAGGRRSTGRPGRGPRR
ncbi:MAG: pseudouridine synthase [Steroidobacteraceae bacterium]|jgi:23S rRNA pseudouridine2457 synthase|nr:pseudouridine synthase [Steroidobacteraceae bacterium]